MLGAAEVRLLRRALGEWGGPARPWDELAYGMGFADVCGLLARTRELAGALADDEPLVPDDWARLLLAVDVVFVSDLAGSGTDWATTTGYGDAGALAVLRSVQRKLGPVLRSRYGRRPAD